MEDIFPLRIAMFRPEPRLTKGYQRLFHALVTFPVAAVFAAGVILGVVR